MFTIVVSFDIILEKWTFVRMYESFDVWVLIMQKLHTNVIEMKFWYLPILILEFRMKTLSSKNFHELSGCVDIHLYKNIKEHIKKILFSLLV